MNSRLQPLGLVLLILIAASALQAQTFDSGSNGSDGALDLTAFAPGTLDFDPTTFTPPLDPDGDNVYHFTTIRIPADLTVRFRANVLGTRPVVWLASGDVQVDGVLDFDGDDGAQGSSLGTGNAIAGAGGYGGGAGRGGGVPSWQPGSGPGGGQNSSSAGTYSYSNEFLLPLIGGSGGAGTGGTGSLYGGGGGAGGGALLLASSTTITVDGTITANAGGGGCDSNGSTSFRGGGGSGGAIRVVASTVQGSGDLQAGRNSGCAVGSFGRIRVEFFQNLFSGSINPAPTSSTPGLVLPPQAPTVRVVRIDGVDAPSVPTGTFTSPDVTIDAASAVTIELEASHIPLGTQVDLTLTSENGAVQNLTSTALSGTFEASTATATANFPHGFSRFYVEATWTP